MSTMMKLAANPMKRSFASLSFCALPLLIACHRDPPPPAVSSDPNQRLAELVRSQDNPVHFESNGGETLWSDGIFVERAAALPAPIQSLRDHPPNVTPPPIDTTSSPAIHDAVDIPGLIETFESLDADHSGWRPGTYKRTGAGDLDCQVTDAQTPLPNKALFYCAYADYLIARYPNGSFRIRDALDPILFLDGDHARGLLLVATR